MPLRRLLVLAVVALACKGTEPKRTPTSVVVSPPAVNLTSIGQTQQLGAAVLDQNGDTLSGQTITWSSNNTPVATVSSTGLVTAVANGSAQVTAHSGTLNSAPANVTVAQAAAALAKVLGDAQTDTVGQQLPTALTVQANDALGSPAAGVTVSFAVTQGGGSLSAASAVTGSNGRVAVSWTLGTTAGAAQQVTATAATGSASPVTFSATAVAGAAASVVVQAGDNQTTGAGTTVPVAPAVLVRDQFNNPVVGAAVSFAVGAGGGSVTGGNQATSSSGIATVTSWTLGSAGTNTLVATVTGTGITGNPVTFTATATPAGAPASVVVSAGDNQTGLVGFAVNVPPAVLVRDAGNTPVPGVQVDLVVTSGGGSVTGGTTTTNAQGIAAVGSWTLGSGPGTNTLTATVAGPGIAGNPVTFTATGQAAAYAIDVRFRRPVSAAVQTAFDSAKAHWQRVVYGDESDVPVVLADSVPCMLVGSDTIYVPAMNETVDDIVIFALLDSIDGPSKILGSATYCAFRSSNSLPLIGLMVLDTADVANFLAQGLFDEIAKHEMGHVLGYHPRLWQTKGVIVDAGGSDPHFTGSQAIAAFDRSGGSGYSAGAKVPLENTGGGGTRDAHWRESVFDTELMTGFVNSGVANPLSVITTASMGDVGYTVNYAGSDPYVVANPLSLRAVATTKIEIREPVLWNRILVVDERGRVVRVIEPR